MKFSTLFIGLISLTICQTVSALVVKEPGEFQLAPDTILRITSEMQGGVPALKYAVRHTNADGKVLSSDSFSSRVDVGHPMVFYWDSSKQVLWWATGKTLVSLSQSTAEKPGDEPARLLPTIYTTDEKWIADGGEKIPPGGIPVAFFEEVKRTFRY